MVITINVNRVKKGEIIEEVFTVLSSKSLRLVNSNERIIKQVVWKIRTLLMLKNYKLLESNVKDNIIINKYEYNADTEVPQLFERVVLNYRPIFEKRCSNCVYEKKENKRNYCSFRGTRLKYPIWKNCSYWLEKPR